jgi:hypothetical protein
MVSAAWIGIPLRFYTKENILSVLSFLILKF